MKSTIAINLYRLSLVLILVTYAYECVNSITNAKLSGSDPIGLVVIVLFVVLIAAILRIVAFFMKAEVRWWDLLALIVVGLVADMFSTNNLFVSVILSVVPVVISAILLARTFRISIVSAS